MADPFTDMKVMLESLEQEQRERYRPKAKPTSEPVRPAQAYLNYLNASCSPSISVDVGWLR